MKKSFELALAVALVAMIATSADAFYARGAYYADWAADAGNELRDDGTNGDKVAGDGIFSGLITADVVAGDYEFKVANADWSISYPNSNVWITTTEDNQQILFTFDTNTYDDGWFPATNIVWSDALRLGSSWEITGGASEIGSWTPGDGAAASFVNDRWEVVVDFATTGMIEYKWTADAVWTVQQFGTDGVGSNADNITYDIGAGARRADHVFAFNPANGRGYQAEGSTPTLDASWSRIKELYVHE